MTERRGAMWMLQSLGIFSPAWERNLPAERVRPLNQICFHFVKTHSNIQQASQYEKAFIHTWSFKEVDSGFCERLGYGTEK